MSCLYLHSVVLSVVVSYGLQERLCVVTECYSSGVQFGLVWSGCTQGAAVVFILLFIVVVVDLTGLQAPGEYRGLEPFCEKRQRQIVNLFNTSFSKTKLLLKVIEPTGTFNLHGG